MSATGIDPSQSLRGDVFRNIVVVFVPGLFGMLPWLVLLSAYTSALKQMPDSLISWGSIIIVAVCLIAGMIFENQGAELEISHWESFKRETLKTEPTRNLDDEWSDYLKLPTKYEVVAARYLGSLVIRIKFLLSFQPACVCSISGFFAMSLLSSAGIITVTGRTEVDADSVPLVSALMALAIAGAYGYTQGQIFSYVKLLANVRRDMISGVCALKASEDKQKSDIHM
jgi:hypothetical protein